MSVTIIGAGPVGLLAALQLANSGVPVNVYEAEEWVDASPRACVWFPPVQEELAKAGVLDEVIEAGEKYYDGVDWRDAKGNVLAGITPPPDIPSFIVALPQPEFCEIVLKRLAKMKHVRVLFNHRFARLEQAGGFVKYWLKQAPDETEVEGRSDYLIGADGSRSSVRRSLGIALAGYTWEGIQFAAVNFDYPLDWKAGNFIVDPEDWCVIVKRGKGHAWRIATGIANPSSERITTLDDATITMIKGRLCRLLPGDTSRIVYREMAPYVVHQRCATRFRDGNVFLVGDAAHLNNPVGALGMTTGLLDAAHLVRSLKEVLFEGKDDGTLDEFAETRRRVFLEHTNPTNTENFLRISSSDPAVARRRADFLAQLRRGDLVTFSSVGLADNSLTTTSDTILNTQTEVTWFITCTKRDDWTEDEFLHEYKGVHASMTRKGVERGIPLRRYIQVRNLGAKSALGTTLARPDWDYVTCLTFPSLFVTHMGLQDPGYKAHAGQHIFCRLDMQGCLTAVEARYTRSSCPRDDKKSKNDDDDDDDDDEDSKNNNRNENEDEDNVGAVRVLVYHKRPRDGEDTRPDWKWLKERAARLKNLAAADPRTSGYTLWRDVTPRNTGHFFAGTQFAGGSWHEFKAVEAFDFAHTNTAIAFLDEHASDFAAGPPENILVVIGEPDIIV